METESKFKQTYAKYFISDKKLINKNFKKRFGRKVNFKNPEYYNDKIQWLKLYWRDPLATKCADKYEVRDYVKEKIGERYLNELLGVYESVEKIDLDKLPQSFVLKGTHGSGYNIICKNKDKMNWETEYKKMKTWLKESYYLKQREWVYKNIKPRIIAERYIEENESGQLKDYKIYCFDGEPKIIGVVFNQSTNTKSNFYDLDWNLLDKEIGYPSDPSAIISKPDTLDEMLELSRKLSKDFPHVRVDFYDINNKVIFGELTFTSENGMGRFHPPEFEKELGSYLNLPK